MEEAKGIVERVTAELRVVCNRVAVSTMFTPPSRRSFPLARPFTYGISKTAYMGYIVPVFFCLTLRYRAYLASTVPTTSRALPRPRSVPLLCRRERNMAIDIIAVKLDTSQNTICNQYIRFGNTESMCLVKEPRYNIRDFGH